MTIRIRTDFLNRLNSCVKSFNFSLISPKLKMSRIIASKEIPISAFVPIGNQMERNPRNGDKDMNPRKKYSSRLIKCFFAPESLAIILSMENPIMNKIRKIYNQIDSSKIIF